MDDTVELSDGDSLDDQWTQSENSTRTSLPNATQKGIDEVRMVEWYHITEAILVGLVVLFGLAGNVFVMQGSIKARRFARQNVYLFFGLSLSDFFVCLIRGPSLIFILFHNSDSPDVICELWMFSGIFVFIGILMNMILAIERRQIMYNFQGYLTLFTPRRVLYTTVILWAAVAAAFVAIYAGSSFHASFHINQLACDLHTDIIPNDKVNTTIFRVIILLTCGFLPICIKLVCYVSIVMKIYKAELLKLDNINEKKTYSRIIRISFARVLLTITCVLPVSICFAIGPFYPEVFYVYVRFLDYLLILRSMISPCITMHDTDFRETFVRRKWRYCSTFKGRSSSKKGSRRSYITSAELKTIG